MLATIGACGHASRCLCPEFWNLRLPFVCTCGISCQQRHLWLCEPMPMPRTLETRLHYVSIGSGLASSTCEPTFRDQNLRQNRTIICSCAAFPILVHAISWLSVANTLVLRGAPSPGSLGGALSDRLSVRGGHLSPALSQRYSIRLTLRGTPSD